MALKIIQLNPLQTAGQYSNNKKLEFKSEYILDFAEQSKVDQNIETIIRLNSTVISSNIEVALINIEKLTYLSWSRLLKTLESLQNTLDMYLITYAINLLPSTIISRGTVFYDSDFNFEFEIKDTLKRCIKIYENKIDIRTIDLLSKITSQFGNIKNKQLDEELTLLEIMEIN